MSALRQQVAPMALQLECPETPALTGAVDRRAFWQIAEGSEVTEATEGPVARAMTQKLA